jgi:hypothetical protein
MLATLGRQGKMGGDIPEENPSFRVPPTMYLLHDPGHFLHGVEAFTPNSYESRFHSIKIREILFAPFAKRRAFRVL